MSGIVGKVGSKSTVIGRLPPGTVLQTVSVVNTANHQSTGDKYMRNSLGNQWDGTDTNGHALKIIKKSGNSTFDCTFHQIEVWFGSFANNTEEGFKYNLRNSTATGMGSPNSAVIVTHNWDTRANGDPCGQEAHPAIGKLIVTTYNTAQAGTTVFFDIKKVVAGGSLTAGGVSEAGTLTVKEIQL